MKWKIGVVVHFGLAVHDPRASSRWWIEKLGLEHQFDYSDGVAVGNDAVTIALFEGDPQPDAIDHMSFHLRSMAELCDALAELKSAGVDLENPGNEIGPEAPGSPHMGLWFHDPDGYRWELSVQNAAREDGCK